MPKVSPLHHLGIPSLVCPEPFFLGCSRSRSRSQSCPKPLSAGSGGRPQAPTMSPGETAEGKLVTKREGCFAAETCSGKRRHLER